MFASVTFQSRSGSKIRIHDFSEPPLTNKKLEVSFPKISLLPDHVVYRIFSYLPSRDMLIASKVCQQWCRVFQSIYIEPQNFKLFCEHFPRHVETAEIDYIEALKEASQINNQLKLIEIIESGRHLAQKVSIEKLQVLYQKMYKLAEKRALYSICLTLIRDLKKQGDQSITQSQNEGITLYFYVKDHLEALPFKVIPLYVSVLQKLSDYFIKVKKDFSLAGKWVHLALSQPHLGPSLKKQLTENAFDIIGTFHEKSVRKDKKENLEGALHYAKQKGESLTSILQKVIDSGDALYDSCCFKEAVIIYAIGCDVEITPDTKAFVELARRKRQNASKCVGNPSIIPKWEKNPPEQLQQIRQKVMQLTGEFLGFQMQKKMTKQITKMIKSLINNCENLIGPKPCEYVILGLGSLSHSGMSLYSDLEFAILLPKNAPRAYFKALAELLELKVIEFGESTPDKNNPHYRKGFSFDDGGNTPVGKELIGTCAELIQSIIFQIGGDLVSSNCLVDASFLYGSKELFLKYKKKLRKHLDRAQYSQTILEQARGVTKEAIGASLQLWNEGQFNVKFSLYRLCSFFVIALSHYFQVNEDDASNDLPSRIDRLVEKKKLHLEIGIKLKEVLNFSALLRNQAQSHYKKENEIIYQGDCSDKQHFRIKCPDMRQQLEELFFTVIIPTFWLLKDLTLSEAGVFNFSPYVQACLDYAEIVLKQNEFERAKKLCHQAMAFHPKNPHAKMLLGHIAYAECQWDEARMFLGADDVRLENTKKAWEMLIAQWEGTTKAPPLLICSALYSEIIASEIHPIFIQAFVQFAFFLNILNAKEAQAKFHNVYEELYKIFPNRRGCQVLIEVLRNLVSPLLWCRDGFLFAFHKDNHLWHEVLNSMVVSHSPYSLEGVRTEKVYLSSDVVKAILKNGQIIRKYEHSRRSVAWAEKAHFKEDPEFPGIEYAINSLSKLIMGRGTPVHDVCKLSYQGRTLLLLISQTMEGVNLRDCLIDSSFVISSYDYSFHFFMAVLTNPEDGASRNFIYSKSRFLTCVDNDHAFADQDVVGSVTGAKAVVKTILYCLPQFDQLVDKEAKKIFCQLDFLEILKLWLENLKLYNKRIFELFSPSEINDWYNQKGVFLPIYLQPGLISKMYQKFFRMKTYLQENSSVTHLQLLELVQPNLAAIYRQAHNTTEGPKAIFSAISNQSYVFLKNEEMSQSTNEQMIELATGQKAPSRLSIQSSPLQGRFEHPIFEIEQKQQWNARLEDPNESINSAQREHSYLHWTKNHLMIIRQKVITGNLGEFLALKDEMFCEKIINRINFFQLTKEIQEKILKLLPKKSFRKLRLRGCSALTDDLLAPILKNSPHLYYLDLSSTNISKTESIYVFCQELQVLKLRGCIQLKTFELGYSILNRDLPKLRVLDLSNCIHLKKLKLPKALVDLNLSHASFPQLDVNQHLLQRLYLKDSSISDRELQNLPILFPQLKYLFLQNCSNIKLSKAKIDSLFTIRLRMVRGHFESIWGLAIMADGTLVSASRVNTIKLWNPSTGELLRAWPEYADEIKVLTILTDGTYASASDDSTIKLWNPSTGEILRTLTGHSGLIFALTVLLDGMLVSAASDDTIKVWDPSTGECLRTWNGHSIWAFTVLPDGTLVSGSVDSTIKLWNPSTGQCLRTWNVHSSAIQALAVMEDGTLVSASGDNTIKLWNSETGECLHTLTEHASAIQTLTILRDGTLVTVSSDGRIIKLWNICKVDVG